MHDGISNDDDGRAALESNGARRTVAPVAAAAAAVVVAAPRADADSRSHAPSLVITLSDWGGT